MNYQDAILQFATVKPGVLCKMNTPTLSLP